jgi:hypothetical protein
MSNFALAEYIAHPGDSTRDSNKSVNDAADLTAALLRRKAGLIGVSAVYNDKKEIVLTDLDRLENDFYGAVQEFYSLNHQRFIDRVIALERKITKNKIHKTELQKLQTINTMQTMIAAGELGYASLFINVSHAKAAVHAMTSYSAINDRANAVERNKVIHANQIRTMVNVLMEILLSGVARSGVIIGAVQSGKTGIGMALILMLSPMLYLITGVRVFPVFISTNQTTHVGQSQLALNTLLTLYGDVEVHLSQEVVDGFTISNYFTRFIELVPVDYKEVREQQEKIVGVDSAFSEVPSVHNYRENIMGVSGNHANEDNEVNSDADDRRALRQSIYIRTPGKSRDQLRKLMATAEKLGLALMFILDEPQYGASGGKLVVDEDGKPIRGCVLKQIFHGFDKALWDEDTMHLMVGLSATPFELSGLSNLFKVWAKLPPNYVGYNCYIGKNGKGRLIDDSVPLITPELFSWETLTQKSGISYASNLPELFCANGSDMTWCLDTFADKLGADRDDPVDCERVYEYARRLGGDTLYAVFKHYASDKIILHKLGLVLRIVANNTVAGEILGLEPKARAEGKTVFTGHGAALERYFDVIPFFGNFYLDDDKNSRFIEDILPERTETGKPALVIVSAKARMGDSFPISIEHYMDFAAKPANMNAALQGMAGRAAGPGKYNSKVFVSCAYETMIRNYVDTLGADTGRKPSNSSRKAPGRPISMVRLGYTGDAKADLVREMLADINKQAKFRRGVKTLEEAKGIQRAQLRKIFDKHDLFNRLIAEHDTLFPGYNDFNYAQLDDKMLYTRPNKGDTINLSWPEDDHGGFKLSYRHSTPEYHKAKCARAKNGAGKPYRSFEAEDRAYLDNRESRKAQIIARVNEETISNRNVKAFIDEINRTFGSLIQKQPDGTFKATGGSRYGRIIQIAEKHNLLHLMETRHAEFWPGEYGSITAVRPGSKLITARKKSAPVDYRVNDKDEVHFTFLSRPNRDSTRPDKVLQDGCSHVAPQLSYDPKTGRIYLVSMPIFESQRANDREGFFNIQVSCGKFDPVTGDEMVDDGVLPGDFRAVMIYLPLTDAASRLSSPKPFGTFADGAMTAEEVAEQWGGLTKAEQRRLIALRADPEVGVKTVRKSKLVTQ